MFFPLLFIIRLLVFTVRVQAQLDGSSGLTETKCPAIPNKPYASTQTLPDPFTFLNNKRVTTKADWACRQQEINALFEQYELGPLPRDSPVVSATLDGQKFNVTVKKGGKSISFISTIYLPTKGGRGPFPAIIGLGQRPNIPIPDDVAVIVTQSDTIASQQALFSRGYGLFYDLYGTNHSAGAMAAWAWGVGRLIDALEKTPAAKINTKRLGVSGCSYNGKGALVVGALEPRIALTIPQEGGTGGSSCWRVAEALQKRGSNVQTARQIVAENVWFSTSFDSFANKTDVLPFDHHMLAGLIAPRALLLLENSDLTALGPESQWGCMRAAKKVWKALGVEDRIGFSQVGGHRRCQFPTQQQPILQAYIDRFLKDGRSGTGGFETDVVGGHPSWSDSDWIDWTEPRLH